MVKYCYMKNKKVLIIIVIVAIIGMFFWNTYNKLIVLNENVENKWAQVDNQYQRRYDLIPSLVSTVKGGMKQEKEIFGQIAEARTRYANAGTITEKQVAGEAMGSALSRLLLIMESYPQLKSIDTVQTLMAQLEGTENRLSVARRDFNNEVKTYNLVVKRLPTSLIAGMFGFEVKNYYEIKDGVEERPEINF